MSNVDCREKCIPSLCGVGAADARCGHQPDANKTNSADTIIKEAREETDGAILRFAVVTATVTTAAVVVDLVAAAAATAVGGVDLVFDFAASASSMSAAAVRLWCVVADRAQAIGELERGIT